MIFQSKEIHPVEDVPLYAECSYPGCTERPAWLVKYLTDGAVDHEYLVCNHHQYKERNIFG